MKTTLLASLLAALSVAFTACTVPAYNPPPPPAMKAAFHAEDYKPASDKGSGRITGQAFLRTRGGDVRTAAGQQVVLYPATDFTRELSAFLAVGISPAEFPAPSWKYPFAPGGRLHPFTRSYQADANGNFEFTDVPAGEYIVGTEVSWQVGYAPQGGFICKEVKIGDSETQRVIVTE